ncbi:MAG TPA: hypothetical protein PL078_07485 [Bacillota bacterium]|nr:hypothetical protein [Bacillota bacterium]HQD76573.1 hypothetical protein [Bacillota bacterium]HUM59281.1 hypothetical protein [Bacillota bacterium]
MAHNTGSVLVVLNSARLIRRRFGLKATGKVAPALAVSFVTE